jgi:hypothetical protein
VRPPIRRPHAKPGAPSSLAGSLVKRDGNPFPSPSIIPDRSSPSRVRFAARSARPGPLRADPKQRDFQKGRGEKERARLDRWRLG